jgi:dethiobiotin synthetase
MQLVISGTDTGVGKTRVTVLLTRGLRALGRSVWLHKPVACPLIDGKAEDAYPLEALCADGQDPASVVPVQLQAAAAPHIAAAAQGRALPLSELRAGLARIRLAPGDVLVEGVGGALVSLCDERATILDLCEDLPVLLVTRPHLGTLNHTALSVEAIQRRGRRVVGLVLNWHADLDPNELALRCAASELSAVTGVPVLYDLPFGAGDAHAEPLARAVLGAVA